MEKITQEMISAKICEIEEPLVTTNELSNVLGIDRNTLHKIENKLGIKHYRIKTDDGFSYTNAYDEHMVRKILEYQRGKGYIRKNKLDITKLLEAYNDLLP